MSDLSERARTGYALANGEGEAFSLLGLLETVKIGRADTNGQFGLLEISMRPGDGSPWHVHPDEDEWFYVLDGNVTVWVADTRMDLGPGAFAFGPRAVPHTFYGAGVTSSRILIGFFPMLFETFLREVGEVATERVIPPHPAGPPDMSKLGPLAKRGGMIILGPPGPPPGH
jgi:mannose-6-phosphate isomerase-like protein (cupin superfamily)